MPTFSLIPYGLQLIIPKLLEKSGDNCLHFSLNLQNVMDSAEHGKGADASGELSALHAAVPPLPAEGARAALPSPAGHVCSVSLVRRAARDRPGSSGPAVRPRARRRSPASSGPAVKRRRAEGARRACGKRPFRTCSETQAMTKWTERGSLRSCWSLLRHGLSTPTPQGYGTSRKVTC